MNGMSLISRRAILTGLMGLIGNVLGTRFLSCANPHPLKTKTAGKRRRHARLDRLSRADAQRDIDRDEAESNTAASPDLGVHQGHRLRVAGDRRRAARVSPSIGRRRDRRVPARRDGRDKLAIPLPDRFRRSLRIQQRPAIESGHRRRASVHGGRARATALPRPRNRKSDLEARPGQGVSRPSGFFRDERSTPLIEGPLLNRECRRAGRSVRRRVRQDNRTRSMAGRQGVGRGLRLAGSRRGPRTAARLRVCRRRVESADRRTDVDRSIERSRRFRISMAKPHVRVRQRLLSGRLRQQGVRLGELSSRRRAGRDSAGLHSQAAVDDAGVWAAFQHADLQGWLSLRVRWTERARRVARVRRCVERQSRVARNARMGEK